MVLPCVYYVYLPEKTEIGLSCTESTEARDKAGLDISYIVKLFQQIKVIDKKYCIIPSSTGKFISKHLICS